MFLKFSTNNATFFKEDDSQFISTLLTSTKNEIAVVSSGAQFFTFSNISEPIKLSSFSLSLISSAMIIQFSRNAIFFLIFSISLFNKMLSALLRNIFFENASFSNMFVLR
ncbi:hypothetical protein DSECCO2_386540 [anaerobic digester metagenome]